MVEESEQIQILYIIGASGLLGKAIHNHFFHPGWTVVAGRARATSNLKQVKRELADLKKENPQSRITIINCAWFPKPTGHSRLDPENLKWVPVTKALVTHCLENQISYYGIGSCLENDSTIQDAYTSAKRQSGKIVLQALDSIIKTKKVQANKVLSLGWLRPYYIYSLHPLTPALIRFVAEQINIQNRTGEKKNIITIQTNDLHDYIEIRACVELIKKIVVTETSGFFDLGTGRIESNQDLIERLFPGTSVSIATYGSTLPGISLPADMSWVEEITR